MKYINISALLVFLYTNTSAQSVMQDKPVIDSTAINEWGKLAPAPVISNNGKYISYIINNQPVHSNTLVIQSTVSSWKREFLDAENGFFSKDNKQFIFQKKDTLYFLDPGTTQSKYITQVGSYRQPAVLKGEWLAYQIKDDSMTVIVKNLLTGKLQSFGHVTEYTFSDQGNVLLLKKASGYDSIDLTWVNLENGRAANIWSAQNNHSRIINYRIDPIGTQLVFMVQKPTGENTIWYYNTVMNQAAIKAGNYTSSISEDLRISDFPLNFSKNGKYIFFRLQEPDTSVYKKTKDAVDVDIWNYKDSILQSTQLLTPEVPSYIAVIGSDKSQVIRLEQPAESIICYPSNADYVVIKRTVSGDKFWLDERYGFSGYMTNPKWLVSLRDGARMPIKTDGNTSFCFSPGGRYLVYNDAKPNLSFYSYDLKTAKTANISAAIKKGLLAQDDVLKLINGPTTPVGIAGWLQDDNALLVYDNYDIWQLDLTGEKLPVNITNGFGRAHNIKFRIVNEKNDPWDDMIFKRDQLLLLTAFDTDNKYNGFYKKQLSKNGDPQLMIMGPWTFYTCPGQAPGVDLSFSAGMRPVKAANVNTWIIRRESSSQASNYFLTTDFREYKVLTDLQPQRKYNWLTTELMSWKQLDGTISEGILYKPENFDPVKSYPLIIHYYQEMSGRLYQFPAPEFMGSNIDIPWFVSRGYLVFTPDIHFAFGKMGQSAYNSVVSAAQMLSKLPYIDAKHIGINGHSYAGFETNYLITHTSIFAAALEGAGTSNWLSSALQLTRTGYRESSRLSTYEWQIGATIWERPDLYLENMPVLKADQATTPLLIFHNKNDNAVPWAQAVELFIALRRLGKPVWMLQYDHGDHGVWGKDAVDYSIRVTQFFDHYLKGTLPPIWMTKGIPAKLKGIETGYELDTETNY